MHPRHLLHLPPRSGMTFSSEAFGHKQALGVLLAGVSGGGQVRHEGE